MDIILFIARTAFLVLIYVFIFILLNYLIRDLQRTGSLGNNGAARRGATAVIPTGSASPLRRRARGENGVGVLRVELAPDKYGISGAEFNLAAEMRLGRDYDNDVVLPGRFASGRHARIYLQNGQYWLEDLGSKNGTFLNGVPLTRPAVLANGDQIKIGDITLKFVRWGYEVESDHRMRPGAPEE
ncbi:FHA domain-containing protein [Desulfallas sp. Bu1-1]|uniref:FHA domain-containing protein n=1 Tax=Desulfallas sp. Bu1-1 TaxID=2787620 RepID=UPI00189F947B|nr:FHA domain-containing protein [Desulfallas sp. Bu1-1]MBF7082333.1 FHA domain-containing protein [Desulfallas sp. Bu1-1]